MDGKDVSATYFNHVIFLFIGGFIVALAMQKWVEYKMKTDPFWKNGATVIVSGPDVPGEGEHKVMDFIRDSQQAYKKKKENNFCITFCYDVCRTHDLHI